MNKRFLRILVMAASLAVPMAAVSPAAAGPATDIVKAKQGLLFEAMKQKPANQKKIQTLFDEMLDYAALAEGSLGSEWSARTDAEKKEFSELLKQLVRKAYEKNLKKTLGYDIDYVGEEPKDGAMVVKTKARSQTDARQDPIEIDFKMLEKQGSWKVQDIVTEGASLVSSWRAQFTKIIKKDGFPVLIKKMKDKLAKGEVG